MEELSESAYYDENKAVDFILSGLGDNSVCGRKDILSVIDAIFDYSKYLGQAPADVDAVIAYCARLAQTDPDPERF